MPMNRALYLDSWEEIALAVKESAGWTCQWCGKPCRRPGESVEDLALRLPLWWVGDLFDGGFRPTRFTLTVAHLDHDPHNPNARLAALCSVCHCRYDLRQMARKRQLEAERNGQLTRFGGLMFDLFGRLNRAFTTQIQIPKYRQLEETDVEQAQQYADHWSTQKDRADRYTALMQRGTVDRAQAQCYFIERLAPLDFQVQGMLKNAEVRALGAARKYSKLIKGAE